MLLTFSVSSAYNTLYFENVFWGCWELFAFFCLQFWEGFSERESACPIFAVVRGKTYK